MKKYNTIGIDLLSAAANDILVMGARPLTFLDYIANDKLKPDVIDEIVTGMVSACKETGVSLVGGETAEMPDTYLPGEHDLVGVITGIVDREKIIDGNKINLGDIILGLPSNGLHTNGYSFARKILFDIGGLKVDDELPELEESVGLTLLAPHINYTNHIFSIINEKIEIKGIAHITGGGLLENIPRILPVNTQVLIDRTSWPVPPIFTVMKNMGKVKSNEMFRSFNMGLGMVLIINPSNYDKIKTLLNPLSKAYQIGRVESGENGVVIE